MPTSPTSPAPTERTLTNLECLTPTVTLGEARALVRALAPEQSLLLLAPPGVGKSEMIAQAAAEAGLPCRSLLGTQIAPEDVSGIPRIVGERAVFCPPRALLPERPEPFCLFLDELPACSPDVQKSLYAVLLERRVGEHDLPRGSWVVAAGNRAADRALVRALSSALVNRVTILNVRVDVREWLAWARASRVRSEVVAFIAFKPDALVQPIPTEPAPFCTPRAWAALAASLDGVERAGCLTSSTRRALAFGRLSPNVAAVFCAVAEHRIDVRPLRDYVCDPSLLPRTDTGRWFMISQLREAVLRGDLRGLPPATINRFLFSLPQEHRFALFADRVPAWGALGADPALLWSLTEVLGL